MVTVAEEVEESHYKSHSGTNSRKPELILLGESVSNARVKPNVKTDQNKSNSCDESDDFTPNVMLKFDSIDY